MSRTYKNIPKYVAYRLITGEGYPPAYSPPRDARPLGLAHTDAVWVNSSAGIVMGTLKDSSERLDVKWFEHNFDHLEQSIAEYILNKQSSQNSSSANRGDAALRDFIYQGIALPRTKVYRRDNKRYLMWISPITGSYRDFIAHIFELPPRRRVAPLDAMVFKHDAHRLMLFRMLTGGWRSVAHFYRERPEPKTANRSRRRQNKMEIRDTLKALRSGKSIDLSELEEY